MVLSRIFNPQKALTNTLPTSGRSGLSFTSSAGSPLAGESQLSAMTNSGWLFSAIRVLANSFASVEWKLFQELPNGEREEIGQHPLKTLWDNPSEFMTQPEFLLLAGNHFAHVGEVAWVKIRSGGTVVQLQPIRPDRLTAVPHRTEFQSGWIYSVGQEKIPLEISDVIFIRHPSPTDPYRGIGPIGSIVHDLGADREASQWTAQFFSNSALPGGVIELDHDLDDAEFDDLVRRWRSAHQGVQNAHRVAIIERGKWVDRAFSVRDLQLTELRQGLRDSIIGALGIPKSLIGATDDVNRANAEASEMIFARWNVVPMLRLIRAGLNRSLAKEFGDNIKFDFSDPTPKARDVDLQEAVGGFSGNILTLNEARRRLLEPPDPEGDQYQRQLVPSIGMPQTLSINEITTKAAENPLYPDEVDEEKEEIESSWARRFRLERKEIEDFLTNLETRGVFNSPVITKLDPSDIDAHNWNWYEKYGADVIRELAESFTTSMSLAAPAVPLPQVQQMAAAWAEVEAGALLRLEGNRSVTKTTRKRVRELVSRTITEGESLNTLKKNLREDLVFSRTRAERVSRTETARGLGQGQKGAAVSQGRNQKRWVTQGAIDDDDCVTNEGQGWIPIEEPFQSGEDTIPQHVNCRCNVIYRTVIEETYCPNCQKRLNVQNLVADSGTIVYCRTCNHEWTALDFLAK